MKLSRGTKLVSSLVGIKEAGGGSSCARLIIETS
jgi:hypothetical protein